jgi:hypothetical protein
MIHMDRQDETTGNKDWLSQGKCDEKNVVYNFVMNNDICSPPLYYTFAASLLLFVVLLV